MIIGVISDTHDRLPIIPVALQYFKDHGASLVIHCGDWKEVETVQYFAREAARFKLPVRGVLGNNDHDTSAFLNVAKTVPGDFMLYKDSYKQLLDNGNYLAVCHGHHLPTTRRLLADPRNTIILRGHSHKPLIEKSDGQLLVNPGSTAFAIPRQRGWQPSVALVNSQALTSEIVHLANTV